jgi:hypothetical protein
MLTGGANPMTMADGNAANGICNAANGDSNATSHRALHGSPDLHWQPSDFCDVGSTKSPSRCVMSVREPHARFSNGTPHRALAFVLENSCR